MEPLWKLLYLLEPASLSLITTAVAVTFASACRALAHGKEMERNRTSLKRHYVGPVPSPHDTPCYHRLGLFTLLLLVPLCCYIKSQLGLMDPFVSRCCSKSFTRTQGILLLLCVGIVCAWLVSGHWLLNNVLGISICIAFVSHVRLPNIKICSLLLICLFVYDVFWVFFSEMFFGENVMVTVATQKASNPVHTVANSLSLPGLQLITKKLELPVKLVFPRNLMDAIFTSSDTMDYMMLGLGDMAIPGMLLALVLCFDHQKSREVASSVDASSSSRGQRYIYYAVSGYAIGLVSALAAGILTRSPQPALLYLVPLTLGPVVFLSWTRNELGELWEGPGSGSSDKVHFLDV
ncbi:unnamed protein product [Spirodela intermedia]|uniref:Uncharacterized protein n=1 Tax=Spirodela intermedia TaxID=51605 RepID=A0A7I8J8M2_SPIIN|nr:unnamed protein product [Spirodela intermedia]CAA6666578.1 unnamed protein product [Spirodela intermedia]